MAVDDEPAYPRDKAYTVLAGVLIAQGDPRFGGADAGAVAGTGRRRRAAFGHVLAVRVLEAVAHAAVPDESAALAALAEALTLAAPEGYLRLFLNQGAPMADLLRTLLVGRRLERPGRGRTRCRGSS